jgi:2'-deoxynucleoside 5'-phosphate N-hydrolase
MEKVVNPAEIFTRDMRWLEECDVVVAEVSTPSHGVGYEVARGLMLNKPVFCCYRQGKRVSKILTGNSHSKLTLIEYDVPEKAVQEVLRFLAAISSGL